MHGSAAPDEHEAGSSRADAAGRADSPSPQESADARDDALLGADQAQDRAGTGTDSADSGETGTAADSDARTRAAPARTTTVLRAFRLGSPLGVVLTGIAARFFMSPLEAGTDFQSHVLFPMREENRGLLVALPVVLTGVDLRLLRTRESRRPAARMFGRLVTSVTAIADAAVVVPLAGNWWTTYLKWGVNADRPLYLAAGIAFLICFSCGQHLLRSQRSQPQPVLLACRSPLRRFVARVTRAALGTTPVPRSQRRPAMIALLLPALILPSTALAPPVLTWPDPGWRPPPHPAVRSRLFPRPSAPAPHGRGMSAPGYSISSPEPAGRSSSPRTAWRASILTTAASCGAITGGTPRTGRYTPPHTWRCTRARSHAPPPCQPGPPACGAARNRIHDGHHHHPGHEHGGGNSRGALQPRRRAATHRLRRPHRRQGHLAGRRRGALDPPGRRRLYSLDLQRHRGHGLPPASR